MKHPSCSNRTLVLVVLVACSLILPYAAALQVTDTVPTIGLSCAHPTHPVAAFSCALPANQAPPDGPPYTIECSDDSTSSDPIIAWRWDFGTGTTGGGPVATHSYVTHGPHAVSLTVSTACGAGYADTITHYVPTWCSVPVPGFTTNVSEGIAPLAVRMTDTSTRTAENLTQWSYWFDNTHSSPDQNPVFTFSSPGNYTINLTVRKSCMDPDAAALPPATRQVRVYPQGSYYVTITPNTTTPVPVTTEPVTTQTTVVLVANLTTAVPTTNTTAPAAAANATNMSVPAAETTRTEGFGTLSLSTNPAGATVYVDEIPWGITPATVSGLPAGPHNLRFEKAGYQNLTTTVFVSSGGTAEFGGTLMQEAGTGGGSGIAVVPVIALAIIVIGVVGGGIFLYLRSRAEED